MSRHRQFCQISKAINAVVLPHVNILFRFLPSSVQTVAPSVTCTWLISNTTMVMSTRLPRRVPPPDLVCLAKIVVRQPFFVAVFCPCLTANNVKD